MAEIVDYIYKIQESIIIYADELDAYLESNAENIISYSPYVDDYESVDDSNYDEEE